MIKHTVITIDLAHATEWDPQKFLYALEFFIEDEPFEFEDWKVKRSEYTARL
jgi:hypothetical protein